MAVLPLRHFFPVEFRCKCGCGAGMEKMDADLLHLRSGQAPRRGLLPAWRQVLMDLLDQIDAFLGWPNASTTL